jgi:hypothetical protein
VASQSLWVVHLLVHVPAVPPERTAQYEYVRSLHGAVVSHGSPKPLTAAHTFVAFLVCPAGHAQIPPDATSPSAHG